MKTANALAVKQIVAEKLGLEQHALSEELSFNKDLDTDSLDLCEVVWEVEKKFNLNIPDEEIEHITTIGDLIGYVNEKLAA